MGWGLSPSPLSTQTIWEKESGHSIPNGKGSLIPEIERESLGAMPRKLRASCGNIYGSDSYPDIGSADNSPLAPTSSTSSCCDSGIRTFLGIWEGVEHVILEAFQGEPRAPISVFPLGGKR